VPLEPLRLSLENTSLRRESMMMQKSLKVTKEKGGRKHSFIEYRSGKRNIWYLKIKITLLKDLGKQDKNDTAVRYW
jgi:hypothetical protein